MQGRRLKRLRARWNLTQRDLAVALGVHPMTVSKAERGVDSLPMRTIPWLSALDARELVVPPTGSGHWRGRIARALLQLRAEGDPTTG